MRQGALGGAAREPKLNLWESSYMDGRQPTYYIDRWIIREYFMDEDNLRGGCSSVG